MVKHREIQAHKVATEVKVKVKIGLRVQTAPTEVRIPPIEVKVAVLTASLRIPTNGKRKHKG